MCFHAMPNAKLSTTIWPVLSTKSNLIWKLCPFRLNKFKVPCAYVFLCFHSSQRCRSREFRGSVLITQCECAKRNGLQLDCPRSECRGRPMCSTKPIPSCCPSKYMWRYANVTMGKPAFNVPKRGACCPKSGDCNPCVVECGPAVCDCKFFFIQFFSSFSFEFFLR